MGKKETEYDKKKEKTTIQTGTKKKRQGIIQASPLRLAIRNGEMNSERKYEKKNTDQKKERIIQEKFKLNKPQATRRASKSSTAT